MLMQSRQENSIKCVIFSKPAYRGFVRPCIISSAWSFKSLVEAHDVSADVIEIFRTVGTHCHEPPWCDC